MWGGVGGGCCSKIAMEHKEIFQESMEIAHPAEPLISVKRVCHQHCT